MSTLNCPIQIIAELNKRMNGHTGNVYRFGLYYALGNSVTSGQISAKTNL